MAAERGWQREFDDPIPLPYQGQLKTLDDAARFIQKLPKAEQQRAHWQLAVQTLIDCAEGRDFPVPRQCRHAAGAEPWQARSRCHATA